MDLTEFASDTKKEAEGVWVPYGKDTRFLIASISAGPYSDRINELREPLLKNLPRGERLPDEVAEACVTQALIDCVLLGWEGLKLNGKDLVYSKDNARAALSEPRLRTFRGWVIQQAQHFDNFRLENYEDLLGNLQRSSATTVQ